jgi:hypothetical protein
MAFMRNRKGKAFLMNLEHERMIVRAMISRSHDGSDREDGWICISRRLDSAFLSLSIVQC